MDSSQGKESTIMADEKTILLISPEPWAALAVSKHHYARTLCDLGHKVLFLDPPLPAKQSLSIFQDAEHPGLFHVQAPPVMRGLRFLPKAIRERIEAHWLARLERVSGISIDVVWLFENSRFYNMSFAGQRLRIYHQVDVNQDFHTAAAAASADICFCTSEPIARRLRPHARHVVKIDHGYAPGKIDLALPQMMEAQFNQSGPHLVYVGALDQRYLCADLLDQAAKQFPGAIFHFFGSYSQSTPLFQAARNRPNVRWWGHVASDLIPAILARSDVLLLAYKAEEAADELSNPHKLMQYLGSGKVTVATWTTEYAEKMHLLEMVRESHQFLPRLREVLDNLENFNSSKSRAERVAFAHANSYLKQVERIEASLKKLGFSLKKKRSQ